MLPPGECDRRAMSPFAKLLWFGPCLYTIVVFGRVSHKPSSAELAAPKNFGQKSEYSTIRLQHDWRNGLVTPWSMSLLAYLLTYNSSSPCWCTDDFTEQLRCTWRKVAHKQPTLSVVNICGPLVSGSCGRSGVSTGQLWSSVFCCCAPVDLEFAAIQSPWPSSDFWV